MQLPQSFRPFKNPTLIVVTDHVHAKLFFVKDRSLELIETISTKVDPMKDRDRVGIKTSGGMRSGEQDKEPTEWSREELYTLLSKNLMQRLQNKEFEDLAFTVPEEHENELKETLHIDLLKRAKIFIPKLLTKEDPLDIITHIQEAETG